MNSERKTGLAKMVVAVEQPQYSLDRVFLEHVGRSELAREKLSERAEAAQGAPGNSGEDKEEKQQS